jgi:serine/threonine-protein kinase
MDQPRSALTSVRVIACAHCGLHHDDSSNKCPRCGTTAEFLDESRATIPAAEKPRPSSWGPELGDDDDDDDDKLGNAAPDPLVGFIVAGRYRIIERLGRGGMGVVYKVEHVEIGKLLALKLLAGELSREREVVRRFKREALLASRLSHPNTVQVFDFGVADGLTYLVMELINGQDLSRIIKSDGAIPFARLSRIVIQICSSLAEAHNLGIVHRDLKPENIIVSKSVDGGDLAKVLDFGLAKLREAPELNDVTSAGSVVGTPYYMAPEQIHGHAVDGRTDIYSLGAVMYKALTGETPFGGSSPLAVFTRHLTEQAVPPHLRAPERAISEAVSEVVMRALEKDPARRFQRVEELQSAIIDISGGLGQSSIDILLNSSQLQQLHMDVARNAALIQAQQRGKKPLVHGEIATRDEVEAFKRKLTHQKWMFRAGLLLLTGVLAYGGFRTIRRATAAPSFNGAEIEPNNQASEANPVPFGSTVFGKLGKRIDATRSDRDFFRVTVPASVSIVSLQNKAIPNMATCTFIYQSGQVDPLAKFCAGRAGVDLRIPSFRITPGDYLLAVMQDREHYETAQVPHVLENVSDDYELTMAETKPSATEEIEPNDAMIGATTIGIGAEVSGTLAWADDVDYVCISPVQGASRRARIVVRDADERPRDKGAVLELTPQSGVRAGIAIRIHRDRPASKKVTSDDLLVPWTSETLVVSSTPQEHCLKLRLTTDPWAAQDAPVIPPASNEKWLVRVEAVP